jgi:hypothetical protein
MQKYWMRYDKETIIPASCVRVSSCTRVNSTRALQRSRSQWLRVVCVCAAVCCQDTETIVRVCASLSSFAVCGWLSTRSRSSDLCLQTGYRRTRAVLGVHAMEMDGWQGQETYLSSKAFIPGLGPTIFLFKGTLVCSSRHVAAILRCWPLTPFPAEVKN